MFLMRKHAHHSGVRRMTDGLEPMGRVHPKKLTGECG